MKISVIIPTMNRLDSLSRTLHYMEVAESKPDEVIVVDQSTDKGLAKKTELLCKKSSLNVYYKWNNITSLTYARNTGLTKATGDILVFMDDDVDVQNFTFQNVRILFGDNNIGMVGGICNDDYKKISLLSVLFGRSSYTKRNKGHVLRSVLGRFPQQTLKKTPTEWAMGFFFVVRRNLVEKYNLKFDENLQYYAYAEDLDFTYRYYNCALKEKLHCYMSNMLTVTHNVSMEYRIPAKKEVYMQIVHRWYLCRKLFGTSFYLFNVIWADVGNVILRVLKRESPLDIIKATIFCIKNNSKISKGNFGYEVWFK